jgi:Transposase IS200 like
LFCCRSPSANQIARKSLSSSSFARCPNRSARSSFTSSLAPRIASLGSNHTWGRACMLIWPQSVATSEAELVHVGGVADHVHIVTTLPRTLSQADLVERIKKTFSKSLPSTPPPLPACGERIEVRGIRKPFSEEALPVRINRRGSRSIAAKEGD